MRDESDAQLLSDVNNGEALIKALGERNIAIERSLNDAKTINEGYMQLMKAVKNNAPFRESHVKSLEIGLWDLALYYARNVIPYHLFNSIMLNEQSWSWQSGSSKTSVIIVVPYTKTRTRWRQYGRKKSLTASVILLTPDRKSL